MLNWEHIWGQRIHLRDSKTGAKTVQIGNLVFDAQIVAVCRESGVSQLVTEDRDFNRFKGLNVVGIE